MPSVRIPLNVEVEIKSGISEFYTKLMKQTYYAVNQAGEVYINIARNHIQPITNQTAQSGQVQDVDVSFPSGKLKSVAKFTVDYSFGRQPDSFNSVVWRQTKLQQKRLKRQPNETDERAIALEEGFYAWNVRMPKMWVKRPYLKQGLPYIVPAFVDFMRDWDQIGSPMSHLLAYVDNLVIEGLEAEFDWPSF